LLLLLFIFFFGALLFRKSELCRGDLRCGLPKKCPQAALAQEAARAALRAAAALAPRQRRGSHPTLRCVLPTECPTERRVLPQPLRQIRSRDNNIIWPKAVCQTFGPKNPLFCPKSRDFQFYKSNYVIISALKLDV
jgi:hypothetical protein